MAGEGQTQPLAEQTSLSDLRSLPTKRELSVESQEDATDGSKKRSKNTTGHSARGVANLTPEQLAKKRANDREAQRAIRERTKNQIENLENRIKELTSQQPYQELQAALKQKELVEAENADLRKRLEQIVGLAQPVIGVNGSARLTRYTSPAQPAILLNRPSPSSNLTVSTPSSATSAGAPQWHPSAAQMRGMETQDPAMESHVQQLVKQRHDMTHNLDMGPEKLGLDFLLDGTQRLARATNGNHTQESTLYPSRSSDRNSPVSSRRTSISFPGQNFHTDVPFHTIPVKNGPSTCPLDTILLEFLHERQSLLATGSPAHKTVGPAYPSVSSLLNPLLAPQSHPLSQVFTDIIATFPDISTLPEKVAILYIMFLFMRWAILPTTENYERLPSWMRPRVSQITTMHPAWIDFLPWPAMRDRMVRDYNPRDYLFDNFFIPFTSTVSVGWAYEDTDCLIRNGGEGETEGEVCINPVFERHLRRLENWSLGKRFEKSFPALQGMFRVGKGERGERG